jgi:hypothetical protein
LMVDDGLPKLVETFEATAARLVGTFEQKYWEAIESFNELRKRYGEYAATSSEFFGTFATFLQHYNLALRDLREKDAPKKQWQNHSSIKMRSKPCCRHHCERSEHLWCIVADRYISVFYRCIAEISGVSLGREGRLDN